MKKTRVLKVLALVLIAIVGLFGLTACSYDVELISDVDFETSIFKHITNGGNPDEESPYNISAITGATLTVEGPAVETSVPLSTKELENKNEGLARGIYKDKAGKRIYEGMDVYYLLNSMSEGESGIVLTDKAYKVVFKDCNRETIAELTIDEITQAHKDKQPVLIAYGVGEVDGSATAPFVFDGANEGEHTLGYVESLDNEDGCLRLVYNTTKYGKNKSYKTFSNVAYVYVCEESEPGFKHSDESGDAYSDPELQNYIISVRGKTLGYELDFTVEQLEALVQYDKNGDIVEDGLGYSDFYSLANNTYWYVNEYEGLDLYKFLCYVGMPTVDELGDKAEDTMITFTASDGYTSAEQFDVATLADPNNFGYYKKNSADMDDGTYKSTPADLVDTGYPVLLAYGVNQYPYTIDNEDDGFLTGLSNNGGPMRVIFGKKEYAHANGSNQIQYLSDIVVGTSVLYNTHAYTFTDEHKEYATSTLDVVVNDVDGTELISQEMKVRDIEDILYGDDATGNVIEAAKVKSVYETKTKDGYESNIYEGVNLEYFLTQIVGIPGTNGTVTFSNGKDKIEMDLNDLFKGGYNVEKGLGDQSAIIAFAKNGSPLVPNEKSEGYVDSIDLNPVSKSDAATYKVDNAGGPLAILIPSSDKENSNAQSVFNVTSITVDVEPDKYAHLEGEYAKLAERSIKFYGEGLEKEQSFTVAEIEGMQKLAQTLDFSMLNAKGKSSEERYRGVALYDLMLEVGVKYNASEVILYASDGTKQTYSLGDIRANDYVNYADKTNDEALVPLLAFGQSTPDKELSDGTPLTAKTGGPLKFIMPQADAKTANAALCMKDVVAVEVTAIEMESWGHSCSDIYSDFLSYEFDFVIKNDTNEWKHTFTLEELEALTNCVERTEYSVLEIGTCEGINLWKLVQHVAGDVPGINNPISVTGYADDGYSKDFLSIFYMEGLENGVLDAAGVRKPIIIAYAIEGYPIVDTEDHEGYTGMAGNCDGPLRFICETNQGASIKYAQKIVVTIEGSGPIECNFKG